jgi:hypothetical protein
MNKNMDKTTKMQKISFWIITILVLTFIIGGTILTYRNKNIDPIATEQGKIEVTGVPGKLDGFAQCLTDKGWTMYGAEWCSHCKDAKAEFGASFRLVKYVECPDNLTLCQAKGVEGFPTWLGPLGQKFEGWSGNSLNSLAEASGCVLPK